jgi:hypothetical protein
MGRSRAAATAIGVAIALGTAGCAWTSNGASPSAEECGTSLGGGGIGPGPEVVDATHPIPANQVLQSSDGKFYFQVAQGCDHGSHVTWIPESAARLVAKADARDGLPVVVVLQPCQSSFRLTATQNGKVVASATAREESWGRQGC